MIVKVNLFYRELLTVRLYAASQSLLLKETQNLMNKKFRFLDNDGKLTLPWVKKIRKATYNLQTKNSPLIQKKKLSYTTGGGIHWSYFYVGEFL